MLTPHCSAVSGMVAPSSTAPITRARKSSEYGFAIHAGLLPAGSLNHIRAGMGIPLRFSLFGKRSSRRIRDLEDEIGAALSETVGVAGGKAAEIEMDPGKSGGLRLLPRGEEPIGNAALIED